MGAIVTRHALSALTPSLNPSSPSVPPTRACEQGSCDQHAWQGLLPHPGQERRPTGPWGTGEAMNGQVSPRAIKESAQLASGGKTGLFREPSAQDRWLRE